jgi:hypothetical protein
MSNAPTPPTQVRAAMMMGQNLVNQNVNSFDGGNQQQFQQMPGSLNGVPGGPRQPLSEPNCYITQGGQMINTSVASQQQMPPSFINAGRIPSQMGFGANQQVPGFYTEILLF